jgi:radical SAM-linked protein
MEDQQENVTAAIIFEIRGLARFLSHQETARMFRRAIARSGLSICYSEGFNPHPKLSLPLPRSVSMASQCELLQINMPRHQGTTTVCPEQVQDALAAQMPEDVIIKDVRIYEDKVKFVPAAVVYLLPIAVDDAVRDAFLKVSSSISSGLPVTIERVSHKTGKCKNVNLADFIQSIELRDEGIEVRASIINGTSLKHNEIAPLFGISDQDGAGAVIRKEVEWTSK